MPSLETRSLIFSTILALSSGGNPNLVAAFPFFAYLPI